MEKDRTLRLTSLFHLWVAGRRAGALLGEALAPYGMTGFEYGLYSLIEASEPVTVTGVSQLSGMPIPTVSRALKELEERGHVERSENPADGRSHLIRLTPEGRELRERAASPFVELMRELESALDRDAELVAWALRRLDDGLRSIQDEVALPPETPPVSSVEGLPYSGAPLTPSQTDEVRRYIDWLRERDA